MKAIYKFPFKLSEVIIIEAPQYAKFVDIQLQGDTYCLWMEVDTEGLGTSHTLLVVGTGHPMDHLIQTYGEIVHLESIQQGGFVWHFYAPKSVAGMVLK